MELISPLLRNDFREFCVSYLVLRQIRDIFDMAGIKAVAIPPERQAIFSGERRTLVEQYYASLNWSLTTDADRFLTMVGYAIGKTSYDEKICKILRDMCARENYTVNGVTVSRPSDNSQTVLEPKTESDRKQLFDTLRSLFNLHELKEICFVYGLAQYEDLKGETISEKARELIEYCERRELVDKLITIVRRERPKAKL